MAKFEVTTLKFEGEKYVKVADLIRFLNATHSDEPVTKAIVDQIISLL